MATATRSIVRNARNNARNNGAPIVEAPAPATPVVASVDVVPTAPATVIETPAPVVEAPATPAPAIVPLANRNGADIFAALKTHANDAIAVCASGVLCAVGGSVDRALGWVGESSPIVPLIRRAAEIRSILNKTAPRDCFVDDFSNPAGVKIGDLYASQLGLSALYRSDNRAALKDARTNARTLSTK